MDPVVLCDSLITWISNFNVGVPHKHAIDFTDGTAMSLILNQLDARFFNDSWLERITKDVGDNYRLKTNNLKKILNQMTDYIQETSGNEIVGFEVPDVSMISEHADKLHLGRMLQLLLGVVVSSPSKQQYIEDIMGLDENVQHVVMTAIQELMEHYQPCAGEVPSSPLTTVDGGEVKRLEERVADLHQEKEEMAQRCHELDIQVSMLHEEKANIAQENAQLQERLNQTENMEDPRSPASIRHNQMTAQIEALQEETYRLEASRDDYKIRCEVIEQDLLESQNKIDELSALAEESRLLKDEIDYLRSASEKASKLEQTLESYKTKLKELTELRGQVKLLEEKNTSFMERTVDLEDELKKANAARSQLETYKRQVIDLHNKLSEETRRADKAEFDAKTKTEKIKNLDNEKKRLCAERDSLQSTNEELQLNQGSGGGNLDVQLLGTGPGGDSLETKEKLIRLQHENKMLRLEQGERGDEKTALLTSDLELANSRVNELETENRLSNRRVLELEVQVKDLQEELQVKGASTEDHLALRHKLQEHLNKLHETSEELQAKKNYIEAVEPQLQQGDKQIQELRSSLKKKEEDMKAMEDRYKKYLEKAKSVIRTLDPNKNQQSVAPQLSKLKSEVAEKNKMLKQLERDMEKTKQAREQEEKLVVNAWYNMGMQLHRKAVDERLSHTSPGQSFLARQRQVSSSRRSQPGSVQRKDVTIGSRK